MQNAAIAEPALSRVDLSLIRTDGGTQMRGAISDVTVATYADHMQDGAEFPAITVFYDGSEYWLADGFHRCAAYGMAGMKEAPADIRPGQRIDAIRYALKANATNGRPRTSDDMRRAYRVAVDNGLCGAADVEAVRELLGCSTRWARSLTQDAREKAKAERDAEIVRLAGEGKTQREIAEEVGVSQQTVMRASDPKRNSSEMDQHEEFDDAIETPESLYCKNCPDCERDHGNWWGGNECGYCGYRNAPDELTDFEPLDTEKASENLHNHRAQGTGENEWYTPHEFIESARAVMGGIDLDPATSVVAQERVGANSIFTATDNGLSRYWFGRVWLNPPYSQPAIQQFIEKVCAEFDSGRVSQAIVLTHNYTDTRWFHAAVASASAICFTRGRIGFLSPEGKKAAPTQGQAFFYFGNKTDLFTEEFRKHGFVVEIAAHCAVRDAA